MKVEAEARLAFWSAAFIATLGGDAINKAKCAADNALVEFDAMAEKLA